MGVVVVVGENKNSDEELNVNLLVPEFSFKF
jgi:hypothetical protein